MYLTPFPYLMKPRIGVCAGGDESRFWRKSKVVYSFHKPFSFIPFPRIRVVDNYPEGKLEDGSNYLDNLGQGHPFLLWKQPDNCDMPPKRGAVDLEQIVRKCTSPLPGGEDQPSLQSIPLFRVPNHLFIRVPPRFPDCLTWSWHDSFPSAYTSLLLLCLQLEYRPSSSSPPPVILSLPGWL